MISNAELERFFHLGDEGWRLISLRRWDYRLSILKLGDELATRGTTVG